MYHAAFVLSVKNQKKVKIAKCNKLCWQYFIFYGKYDEFLK